MRIWDIPPEQLCNQHLLGEHNELHAMWNIITQGKKGYSHHPETIRWRGKLKALFGVHESIAGEMLRRGYNHKSPLNKSAAKGASTQTDFVDSVDQQRERLRAKGCACKV